jgi:hypothetical protein
MRMGMSEIDELLRRNEAYAASFDQGPLNEDRSYAVGAQLGHSHRHIWGVLANHSPYVGIPSCQLRKS